MRLVIDSNIVFSAIISASGKTRFLLFSDKIQLLAPEFLLQEIEKHKQEITTKSKLSPEDFEIALSIISSKIRFIPFAEFEQFIPKAEKNCPDPNDTEYFALTLSKNIPFWSNDKALKKQSMVKILSTTELLKEIEQ